MDAPILILAVAGGLAILLRAGRALFLVLRGGADAIIARDVAATLARRGDLTGLQEARVAHADARRRRYLAVGVFSLWIGLLLIPSLTPWPRMLYALYSLLWLVPRRARPLLR
jgi:hypothetical protein